MIRTKPLKTTFVMPSLVMSNCICVMMLDLQYISKNMYDNEICNFIGIA